MERFQAFYRVIRDVPRGKVATYGQIAKLAGFPGAARQVGRALFGHSDGADPLPWYRILNAQGKISLPQPEAADQRKLLEAEGVVFSSSGVVSFKQFGWAP